MKDLNIEDLKQLLSDGIQARQYAWDHYEELLARKPAYTLYGPYDYWIGAATPEKIISKASRVLTFKTRKKSYLIYELDSEYKLLRARKVFDSVNDNTYECFELDGIQYACPFLFNQKNKIGDEVVAVRYQDGKPAYLGLLRENSLIVHFFDYVSPEKAEVTEYYYYPASKYSMHGYPTDLDAPVGELNSAGQRVCWEEELVYTDFSQWFKKEDNSAAET